MPGEDTLRAQLALSRKEIKRLHQQVAAAEAARDKELAAVQRLRGWRAEVKVAQQELADVEAKQAKIEAKTGVEREGRLAAERQKYRLEQENRSLVATMEALTEQLKLREGQLEAEKIKLQSFTVAAEEQAMDAEENSAEDEPKNDNPLDSMLRMISAENKSLKEKNAEMTEQIASDAELVRNMKMELQQVYFSFHQGF